MRVVLTPLPVLVACAGCARGGQVARDAGADLDRRGRGELAWLGGGADSGTLAARVRSRWPVVALDGCSEGCARAWLASEGVVPQGIHRLAGMRPEEAADRIAAQFT